MRTSWGCGMKLVIISSVTERWLQESSGIRELREKHTHAQQNNNVRPLLRKDGSKVVLTQNISRDSK